jgi:hypothetical protein
MRALKNLNDRIKTKQAGHSTPLDGRNLAQEIGGVYPPYHANMLENGNISCNY